MASWLHELHVPGSWCACWSRTILLRVPQAGDAIGGGWALALLINRIDLPSGLDPPFALAGAIGLFAATQLADGSGFLAIYLCGVMLRACLRRPAERIIHFHEGLAWLAQIARRVCWQLKRREALRPVLQLSALEEQGRQFASTEPLPEDRAALAAALIPIGRGAAPQLSRDDACVSTRPARAASGGNGVYLEALASPTGSYANTQRITAPTTITLSDTVRIGRTIMRLEP